MTVGEALFREGLEEGLEKGRAEGRVEEKRLMIERLAQSGMIEALIQSGMAANKIAERLEISTNELNSLLGEKPN